MHGVTVLILSRDARLIRAVEEAAPRMRIRSGRCLAEVERVGVNTRLVIDPRVAGECCLEGLSRLRPRSACQGVVYLSLPARPDILLRLPQVCPGVIASLADLLRSLRESSSLSTARSAWLNREAILRAEGLPAKARDFLGIARQRERQGCTVDEAAAALSLGVRALNRLCRRSIGYPPGIVLDVARVKAISRDLLARRDSLRSLATAYRYPDEPALSNQFLRFVGMRPGAYRARFAADAPSSPAIPPS